MSQINPLSVVLIWDNAGIPKEVPNASRETSLNGSFRQAETDNATTHDATSVSVPIPQTGARLPRPTATALRRDGNLLAEVERDRKQYAKGSKENQFERAAHNLRNDDSNPRNNLAKRLRRIVEVLDGQTLPLFAPADVVRLRPDQRAALDYWQGTRHEINL